MISNKITKEEALFEYCLRLADDRLILCQNLGEWCGHGPYLEEDIALTNIALDLIGQANNIYEYAVGIEGKGRSADQLAMFRSDIEFRNLLLVEQANGDYAQTICRSFFFDAFSYHFLEALTKSTNEHFAAFATKSLKENKYHLRHTSKWIVRFGDGTEESRQRLIDAIELLWMYVGEMFTPDIVDEILLKDGIAVDLAPIKTKWLETINQVFTEAKIEMPSIESFMQKGGRHGVHTEELGHTLAIMQILPRSMPDAQW